VFLKIQPYVHSSLALRANQKLAFKFFRPLRVVQRVGAVPYKLELPASSNAHPIFHVSQLKAVVGAAVQVSPSLPSELADFQVSERVLQHRIIFRGVHPVVQGLIKWL
jgi:hypothetical protein